MSTQFQLSASLNILLTIFLIYALIYIFSPHFEENPIKNANQYKIVKNVENIPNAFTSNNFTTINASNPDNNTNNNNNNNTDKNKVDFIILIPVRNRDKDLLYSTNYLTNYINKHDKDMNLVKIFIIEQNPDKSIPFNKGLLFNIGVLSIKKLYKNIKWLCLHDVDIVPIKKDNKYPSYKPIDINKLNPKHLINYIEFKMYYDSFGGIVCLNINNFVNKDCLNGFSNNYWGWGCEDDDLRLRVRSCGLRIDTPLNENHNMQILFEHNRDPGNYYDKLYNITLFDYNHKRMANIYKTGTMSKIKKIDGYSNIIKNDTYFKWKIIRELDFSNIVYKKVNISLNDPGKTFKKLNNEFDIMFDRIKRQNNLDQVIDGLETYNH